MDYLTDFRFELQVKSAGYWWFKRFKFLDSSVL